jgi:hypothetical protein
VLPFTTKCVFLFAISCVFFVVHCGKGICLAFLRVCNGRVIHFVIGFHVGGSPFTFGLSIVGFRNVG